MIYKRNWQTRAGKKKTAWVVAWFTQGEDGKRKRHIKTFPKEGMAKDWLDEKKPAIKQGTHKPDSQAPTLAAACEAWIRRGEAAQKERSTIEQRRQHVKCHILPLLPGNTKLSRLTPGQIEAFQDELLCSRSRALAKKVMTSLKAILKQAKMAHLAANLEKIETGGRHRRRLEVGRDIPSPAEVNALLKAATGYVRPLLAVAVFCGLRASELRGLRWQDLDFEDRRLHVRQRVDRWNVVGVPKSDTSYRSVPMAPFVMNTLKEWRLTCPRQGVKKDDKGNVIDPGELLLVLPNGKGNAESLANVWNRHLAPLQCAAGVSVPVLDDDGRPVIEEDGKPKMRAKYGLHAFRHFFASWRLDQGDNIKRVSVLMGHSSPVVTLTLYSHMLPQEDEHERFAAGEMALLG